MPPSERPSSQLSGTESDEQQMASPGPVGPRHHDASDLEGLSGRPDGESELLFRRKWPCRGGRDDSRAADEGITVSAHHERGVRVVLVTLAQVGVVVGGCPPQLDDAVVAHPKHCVPLRGCVGGLEPEWSETCEDALGETVDVPRPTGGVSCHAHRWTFDGAPRLRAGADSATRADPRSAPRRGGRTGLRHAVPRP